jgi:hypothetical protein
MGDRLVPALLALAMAALPASAEEPARETPKEPARPPAPSQAQPAAPQPAPPASAQSGAIGVYRLPTVGKPRRRVGAGRRGPEDPLPEVWALVPEHVALTSSEQPSLFWYLSATSPGDVLFELTLIDAGSVEPLIGVRLPAPRQKGLQRVDLADHDVRLAPGQEYQWSLALVVDPEQRSHDVVASGWIERVAAPEGLAARVAAAGPAGAASVYAEAGLWYDALRAVYSFSEQRPGDPEPQRQLDALLTQVGLPAFPLSP